MKTHFDRMSNQLPRIVSGWAAVGPAILLASAFSVVSPHDVRGADNPEFYKVQIVRPMKVGDRVHMRREIEQTTTESTEGNGTPQGAQSATTQINFYGTLEVLAIDGHGEPTKWKVSGGVVSVRRAGSSGRESLLKSGTDFTVAWAGGKATVADSDARHPLSDDARRFLPIVFEATGAKGDSSLGDILDNISASKGTSWSVNSKAVATGLHNFDPKLKAADVSGSARIKAIVGDGDKKTLLVEYEFTATSKKPSNSPDGMTPVGASRTESGTLTVPANLSTGYFSAKATIHTSSRFTKNASEKMLTKAGTKTVTKNVKLETVIDEYDKVNTLLTYETVGGAEQKDSSAPSTSKPAAPASAGASNGSSSSAEPPN